MTTVHGFVITYCTWHRTQRRLLTVRVHLAAGSPWGALRQWWRLQRQFQPRVQDVRVEVCHTAACPRREYPTHWAYACRYGTAPPEEARADEP